MRRSYDKHIRLTKEEKDEWQRKAEMACLNESALVRLLMKGYKPKKKPNNQLQSLSYSLFGFESQKT